MHEHVGKWFAARVVSDISPRPNMKPIHSPRALSSIAVLVSSVVASQAAVKLPALMSDNMVLQAEAKTNVWGWADPAEKVSVSFVGKTASATTGADGKWSVKLQDLKSGTTGDLSVKGTNEITVKNVVVGEVWVASGQSNMEFTMSGTMDKDTEIAAANDPMIRMFTVKKATKSEPQENCVGQWEITTPQTAGHFSAVGYFFARRLRETLKQPVGIIHTSWGGTPAEYWTPMPVIAADPDFKPLAERWEKMAADFPKAQEAYEKAKAEWQAVADKAKTDGVPAPKPPSAPRGGTAEGAPGSLYNGMIAPVVPYTIQGAIWYQGESNAGNALQYRKLFPSMILSWRKAWMKGGLEGSEMPDFPFLFVQLANYKPRHDEPTESDWAALREAQLMTLEMPRTGMAVAIDIGDGADIHPKNKQEVGRRLALCAEATVYYRDQEFSGPIFVGAQAEDGKIRLSFRNADGMKAQDGGPLKGFALAGEDKVYHWAEATVQGDHIIVTCKDVPTPVAVRYAWADNPECNLVNSAGLPASPFRAENWSATPPK